MQINFNHSKDDRKIENIQSNIFKNIFTFYYFIYELYFGDF